MRLTKKDGKTYFMFDKNANWKRSAEITKLGQLEDIEDELGIDLITLLKAVKDGVYVKHCYDTPCEHIDYEPFRVDYWKDYIEGKEGWLICGFEPEDYGKYWALTKEELE